MERYPATYSYVFVCLKYVCASIPPSWSTEALHMGWLPLFLARFHKANLNLAFQPTLDPNVAYHLRVKSRLLPFQKLSFILGPPAPTALWCRSNFYTVSSKLDYCYISPARLQHSSQSGLILAGHLIF